MRGCLFVLIGAAVVVSIAAWFGSPILASAVVDAGLRSAGFASTTLTTTVSADPPPRLLLGHADSVRVQGDDVSFRTFHAAHLELAMADVDLVGRSFATIRGTITGAEVNTADNVPTTADVEIDGPAANAAAVIRMDGATVDRVIQATLATQIPAPVIRTELVAPDVVRIVTPAATLGGRIVIDASGAVALENGLGRAPVLRLDPSFPLRLRSATVVDGDLRIDATLDAEQLFGG
jgi:hypothetical protein